MENWKVVAIRA